MEIMEQNEYKELAIFAAETLSTKKALDIIIIAVGSKATFAEYMVLASGSSIRQIGALTEELEEAFAKKGIEPKSIQGKKESGWILMDYKDIIISVLTTEMREKYNIEKVWADCEFSTIKEEA